MIGDTFDFKAPSLVAVIMHRETPEEAEKQYKEITERLIDEYYPILTGWLEKQEIVKKAHNCLFPEDLEKVRYDLIPDTFFEDLTAKVNGEKGLLNDAERMFILIQLSDRIVFAAKQYCNTIMRQRLQVLMNNQKPRIIT